MQSAGTQISSPSDNISTASSWNLLAEKNELVDYLEPFCDFTLDSRHDSPLEDTSSLYLLNFGYGESQAYLYFTSVFPYIGAPTSLFLSLYAFYSSPAEQSLEGQLFHVEPKDTSDLAWSNKPDPSLSQPISFTSNNGWQAIPIDAISDFNFGLSLDSLNSEIRFRSKEYYSCKPFLSATYPLFHRDVNTNDLILQCNRSDILTIESKLAGSVDISGDLCVAMGFETNTNGPIYIDLLMEGEVVASIVLLDLGNNYFDFQIKEVILENSEITFDAVRLSAKFFAKQYLRVSSISIKQDSKPPIIIPSAGVMEVLFVAIFTLAALTAKSLRKKSLRFRTHPGC